MMYLKSHITTRQIYLLAAILLSLLVSYRIAYSQGIRETGSLYSTVVATSSPITRTNTLAPQPTAPGQVSPNSSSPFSSDAWWNFLSNIGANVIGVIIGIGIALARERTLARKQRLLVARDILLGIRDELLSNLQQLTTSSQQEGLRDVIMQTQTAQGAYFMGQLVVLDNPTVSNKIRECYATIYFYLQLHGRLWDIYTTPLPNENPAMRVIASAVEKQIAGIEPGLRAQITTTIDVINAGLEDLATALS